MRQARHLRTDESVSLAQKRIASNTVWNLAGQIVPALIGIVTVPVIVSGLGVVRFGILALAWTVVGYFSVLDLGLGRALTRQAAATVAVEARTVRGLVWAAWGITAVLGILAGMALFTIAPWLVTSLFDIGPALRPESLSTVRLLAIGIPIVTLSSSARGFLEAEHRFDLVNAAKLPAGILTFLLPAVLLIWTDNVAFHVAGLLAVRTLAGTTYVVMALRIRPELRRPVADRLSARKLLPEGLWMFVSNVISPMMTTLDRVFIGAMISVAAVSFYAPIFEIVTRALVFPTAVAAVLYPAIAAVGVSRGPEVQELFSRGLTVTLLLIVPALFGLILYGPELVSAWLGVEFSAHSTGVLRWLAIGVLMNGVAAFPFALVQARGHARATAKLHAIELPLYLVTLVVLIAKVGVIGAAVAWALRTTVDMALLLWIAHGTGSLSASATRSTALRVAGCLAVLAAAVLPTNLSQKAIVLVAFSAVYIVIAAPRVRALAHAG